MSLRNIILHMTCLFLTTGLFGQEAFEKLTPMSLGLQNGFSIDISGANKNMGEDALKEVCASSGTLKYNKKAKEWQWLQAKIPGARSFAPWSVFVLLDEQKNTLNATFFFDTGDAFVSQKELPDLSNLVREWVREFYFAVSRKVVAEEVKEEEKKLQDLTKELEKLQGKKDQFQKDIEKATLKIAESQKAIELNLKDQEHKKVQITDQQVQVKKSIDKYNSIGKKND